MYQRMGAKNSSLGQLDKALVYLNKALAIQLKALGSEHVEVARTQYGIALVNFGQGSYGRAKELFEACTKIYSRVYGADHAWTQDAIQWTQGSIRNA